MWTFNNEPKTSVLLKVYPKYKLYGRLKKSDLEKYNKTHDESLIIYKYCENVPAQELLDYYHMYKEKAKEEKEKYRAMRRAQGYTSL